MHHHHHHHHHHLSCTWSRVLKLLSEDPTNYADAPREGIRRILEEVTGQPHPRNAPLDTARLLSIRMGTTVATNALLERHGERTALLVTAGFPDLLHIANQSRPNIFDLEIRCPDSLYEAVVEVDEQVIIPLGDEPSARNGKDAATNSTWVLWLEGGGPRVRGPRARAHAHAHDHASALTPTHARAHEPSRQGCTSRSASDEQGARRAQNLDFGGWDRENQ
jgi:hypothetical protein